jgi:nucleoside phosphorylase
VPEYVAARAFLDREHDGPEKLSPSDGNDYTLGEIASHNIVIAALPDGEYGTSSAAIVARDMLHSFPNIRICLMVGLGGGAPSQEHDIRLGDIVVSASCDGTGSVFQYDFGRTVQGRSFNLTGFLSQPPTILRVAVNGLRAQYEQEGHQLEDAISRILEKPENQRMRRRYKQPDPESDRLYQSQVIHPLNNEASCTENCGDDPSKLTLRRKRTDDEDNPAVHYGLIASGNQLMKDALLRDALIAEKGVLCFEMAAAGLVNHFPCLVIRGICDYSDSHKNKEWYEYAAMVAAAYAKDLLCRIDPQQVEVEKKISDILTS